MGLPENIDALLVKYDITQDSLARIAGVTPGAVTGWRKGSRPRQDAIANICTHFNLNQDDLLSDTYGLAAKEHNRIPSGAISPSLSPEVATAPLLGRVHAGDAQEPEILDDTVELPASVLRNHPNAYFLLVEGNCMDRVYPEGCYILIDPDRAPQNGSIAVVSIDGEDYVMRRMTRGASTLMLSPDSTDPKHEDIVITSADDHTVEFFGTVVWYQASKELE